MHFLVDSKLFLSRFISILLVSLSLSPLLLLGISQKSSAQQKVPTLSARVTDETGTLTSNEIANLDQILSAFEKRKGSQIVILMVPTTAPESIEQYGIRVADQWKLGRKQVDDGAILIIAKSDRALRIEVGYGLEGVLTDVASKRIIDQIIVPHFKQQDFYGGINAGVRALIRLIDGEALPSPTQSSAQYRKQMNIEQYLPAVLVIALVLGGILRSVLGRFPGSLVTGGVVAVLAWLIFGAVSMALFAGAIALVIALTGIGFGRRGFGGHSSGGGGGSFSGGGGGFGGGGSSGRW